MASVLHVYLGMRVARYMVLKPYSYFHMMWRAHNRVVARAQLDKDGSRFGQQVLVGPK